MNSSQLPINVARYAGAVAAIRIPPIRHARKRPPRKPEESNGLVLTGLIGLVETVSVVDHRDFTISPNA